MMANKTKKKSAQPRTKVRDLPKQKRELSKEEQKRVKGGAKKSGTAVTDEHATPGVINWLL